MIYRKGKDKEEEDWGLIFTPSSLDVFLALSLMDDVTWHLELCLKILAGLICFFESFIHTLIFFIHERSSYIKTFES